VHPLNQLASAKSETALFIAGQNIYSDVSLQSASIALIRTTMAYVIVQKGPT